MKVIVIILGIIGILIWFEQSSLWTINLSYMKDGNLFIYTNINWFIFIGGIAVIIALTIILYRFLK